MLAYLKRGAGKGTLATCEKKNVSALFFSLFAKNDNINHNKKNA